MRTENLTLSERERAAYQAGDYATAELLAGLIDAESTCSVRPHIEEARGCFPAEDCLQSEIESLRAFSRRLRGDNKAELQRILEALETRQTELWQSGEYGADELRQALEGLPK